MMSALDWTIIGVYLSWIVWDGIRLSKNTNEIEGYFLASRSLPWWAVGLSVMATQLSAITMIGTTGQGYAVGISLLQQYYALPIAMIIIAVTFVPFFHHARIFTAYEFLGSTSRRRACCWHCRPQLTPCSAACRRWPGPTSSRCT
jgi:SSS family solute:Na+ symporter